MTRSTDNRLRRAAWASVMVLLLQTLAVVAAPLAHAQLSGHVVDCDDESGNDTQTNAAGDDEIYSCLVTSGGNPVNGARIDVENLGTANDRDAGATGAPDFNDACTTGVNGVCQFTLEGDPGVSGTANVCFWSDTGNDNTFALTGPEEDGSGCDDEAAPAEGDGNGTDVVEKIWTAPPATATALDCDDESGDDSQTNAVGQAETYTCLATAPDSGDAGTERDPVPGVRIDWENLNGANDPDNSSAAGSPDANDACTTNAQGLCTIAIGSSEGQPGSANICFWGDTDNDNVFDPNGNENDGGGCNNESVATEDLDLIDVVTKTWTGVTPTGLDCDDQSGDDAETNQAGESESYTCTATAPDGSDAGTERDPVPGIRIDWENLNGANDPDNSSTNATPDGNDACTTASNGSCVIVIAASEGQTGSANICFWADTDADNVFDSSGATNDGGGCNQETPATEDVDLIDVVSKTWAVTADGLDCDDQSGDDDQSNNASEAETYTCSATAPDSGDPGNERDPVSGVRIDWENLNGANDPDNSSSVGTPDGNDACTTSAQGTCTITISPSENQLGTANICFWSDLDNDNVFDPNGNANDGGGCNAESAVTEDTNLIDVVSKTWSNTLARMIGCTPETADREITTTHTVTCVVTNISGAPVAGVGVTFSEAGTGDLTSATTAVTNASGQVTVTASSSAAGTQQITATITDDLTGAEPGDVDECDRVAGDPSGAPAGDCDDTVDVVWEQRVTCLGQPGEIVGTTGDDTITGTAGDDVICAGPGDDVVNGLGGNDLIFLQGGNDRASGGGGHDTILGGRGRDSISGNGGRDVLRGRGGSDLLRGGGGRDILLGGGGSDTLRGGRGSDDLRGGRKGDRLFAGPGNDILNGGGGRRDLCRGGRGNDVLRRCERR
ncbi:MAG: Ig-like domain-containing protein [Actinomycetota bacterium]|nr:Ig-like domain-containing protein [Actinomycetota bacterium]